MDPSEHPEIQARLAEAAGALLAGRPAEARAAYAACREALPRLAATGMALAGWLAGDWGAVGRHAAEARALGDSGFLRALGGLAGVHAGDGAAIREVEAGLEAARAADDGSELNAAVALADAWIARGELAEARGMIAALRPVAREADARLAVALLDRLALAEAVRARRPEAEALVAEAIEAARAAGDDAGLAWALRCREAGRAAVGAVDAAALARLGATLAAIAAEPTPEAVQRAALAAFVAAAGCERGFLLRLDGLEVIDQVIHGAAPDSYSTSLADRVIWSGEPLVVADLAEEPALGEAASVRELALRAALGMPLVAGGEVVGVMLADSREAHPGFEPAALAAARAIADQVVAQVAASGRAAAAEAEAAAAAALGEAALAAAAARTLDEALPAIAAAAGALLGAERLFVVRDGEVAAALDRAGRPLYEAAPSQGAVDWVVAHGAPLVVVDVEAEAALAARPSVRGMALRAIHAAPAGDAGVLYLDSREPAPPHPDAARRLAGLAAIVAAVAARSG